MHVQNSYEFDGSGTLFVVPTPIGNLEDITFRALRILKEADLIACEDTRHTQKLLTHFDIQKKLISYHEHNEKERTNQLIEQLRNGKQIALVSDAGMPAISDPGSIFIQEAIQEKIRVVVLPGANAALCALVGSGLSTDEFLFYGFLPRKKKDKQNELARLKSVKATLILYESPHRIRDTIRNIKETFGERKIAIARELTKIHEQFIRGTIEKVSNYLDEHEIKGECCIVIEGSTASEVEDSLWWSSLSIEEHVQHYETHEKLSHKEAMKKVAKERNIPKRDVYRTLHIDR